jgi:O-antigen ligase
LHPGSIRSKIAPCIVAALLVVAFLATPLGARRVASESATNLAAGERGETTSSLDTRLYRWKTLLPEWERAPVFGQGLGTTTTSEGTSANPLNGLLPHNEYIRYLVETGVVGLTLLAVALGALVRALIRSRRKLSSSTLVFNAQSLGLAIVIGCLVNSLADNTLLNSPTGYAAALIIAAILAVRTASRQMPAQRAA